MDLIKKCPRCLGFLTMVWLSEGRIMCYAHRYNAKTPDELKEKAVNAPCGYSEIYWRKF